MTRSFAFIVENIMSVYVTASRLCGHWNLVRFEKRAVKTLQHVYKYGDIRMLYDMIEWLKILVIEFSAIIDTNYIIVTNY